MTLTYDHVYLHEQDLSAMAFQIFEITEDHQGTGLVGHVCLRVFHPSFPVGKIGVVDFTSTTFRLLNPGYKGKAIVGNTTLTQ